MNVMQFTPATWVGAALALVVSIGIIYIGICYIIAPKAASAGFGFRSEITEEVAPWQHIKGPRDIVSGLVVLAMLILFGPAAAAVILFVEALVPIGDGLTIVRHHGRLRAAIGIHFATAAGMVLAACLLLV